MGSVAAVEAAVNIEAFGAIQADLAAGVARADVLAWARITDVQLAATTQHWLRAMAEEVKRGRTALSQRYAKAYLQRRPDLARDPEQDEDRLALAAAPRKPAVAAQDETPAPPQPEEQTARALPSYMREESTSDRTGPPLPPTPHPPAAAHSPPPAAAPAPGRAWLDPPTMPSAGPVVTYAAPPADPPASRPIHTLQMTAMPDMRAAAATPFSSAPPSRPAGHAAAASPPPPSTAAPGSARPAGGSLTGTAMSFEVPASFKAVPFSTDKPPPSQAASSQAASSQAASSQAASSQAAPSQTAPPTSAPPESLPFGPTPKKSAPMTGTMMAMDIPAGFKAVPFSSDAPPSARPPPSAVAAAPPSAAPAPSSATPSTPRGSLSGTALSFDVPEHLKKIPLTGGPPSAPAQPPPHAAPHPVPQRAPSQPNLPALPSLPPLEDYVRMGVELASTPADRVDAYLAQARWTRATWATVDQTYRARFAREPELQAAFQTALARERARRAGGPR